ncbi:conjugal transfer protein TraA [Orientia tsutsugamushi]|uniref:Conjugal transfer protein TraA n=1 Tax=Orientia tsutsugamushi TaxID=784 RepID=A0A2R8F2Q7_ORITS|nr:conjugal transfer protein TraA [Orientia tsutsugamushi]
MFSIGSEENFKITAALFCCSLSKISLPIVVQLIAVDEAEMIGTKAYTELFRVVRKNNYQLMLAGDEKQLASIERGGI